MFVVGTAGHVDHGKSSLVRALTGINPDRLREEQEREMTIDLGFAWVELPSGREISIVDVPGHEDFIKNMLAGVGGIDLALLVVAADEAVMPQTREHLEILNLLRVPNGVVALTKADLIEDPDWLDLVTEELRETLAPTVLAEAPIVPVSAVTGQGLPELLQALDTALDHATPRPDVGVPRLPVDRVFSIAGFGTVVTGTLAGGHLTVGDTIEIVPGGRAARIRGLQAHKARIDRAVPGMRVAANLAGIDVADIARGQVLALPGTLAPTTLIDLRLEAVSELANPLRHGMEVEFFAGAASVVGRLRMLDTDELHADESCWAQIALNEPLAIARGDRFVVRLASPSVTVGGGAVVEAHPVRRHRRHDAGVLERLQQLQAGDPAERVLALLDERGALAPAQISQLVLLSGDVVDVALTQLQERGSVVLLGQAAAGQADAASALAISTAVWNRTLERIVELVRAFHEAQPLRPGMPREEIRSRLGQTAEFLARFLEEAAARGLLSVTSDWVALPDHRAALSPEDERAIANVMDRFRASPYTPPGWAEVEEALGPRLARYLQESGRLVRLTGGVTYASEDLEEMIERLRTETGVGRTFTVAEVRDLFATSRKYVVAFLEETDRRRVTRRVGDVRVLR